MIEMLIGLLMTAGERTCLVEAEHPLVIEAQELAAANDMAGVVILAWGSSEHSSEECQLFIAPHPQPADMAEGAKSAATKLYDWWNSPADHEIGGER
jgi:predicted membrane-bound mannosyltransferase